MSSLSEIHLRQARSFLEAGDPHRAVELLEKARALAHGDAGQMDAVLKELTIAYEQTGQPERAARCRSQVRSRKAPARASGGGSAGVVPPPPIWRVPAWFYVCLVAILGIGGALVWLKLRLPAEGVATTQPATNPPANVTTAVPSSAAATMPVVGIVPATSITPSIKGDLGEMISHNVGLLVVLGHYEGRIGNQPARIDVPLATGTAFVVTQSGRMLTNRHVVDGGKSPDVESSLQSVGLPTLTLRSTTYLVCFGPDANDRLPATLKFASDRFDLAVLKVERNFDSPLTISSRAPRQGDDVSAVGYPGVLITLMNGQFATDARVTEVFRRFRSTRNVDLLADLWSPESFKPALTRGVVSVAERVIDGVSHTQFDAKISPGNSGGPLLGPSRDVCAIVSQGGVGPAAGYNFGILIDQLHDELEAHLVDP